MTVGNERLEHCCGGGLALFNSGEVEAGDEEASLAYSYVECVAEVTHRALGTKLGELELGGIEAVTVALIKTGDDGSCLYGEVVKVDLVGVLDEGIVLEVDLAVGNEAERGEDIRF